MLTNTVHLLSGLSEAELSIVLADELAVIAEAERVVAEHRAEQINEITGELYVPNWDD